MRAHVVVLLLVAGAGPASAAPLEPSAQAIKAAPVPFPFGEWGALLGAYTDDRGRVDYAALKANERDRAKLERVFAAVAASSPDRAPERYPTRAAKLAYYIDAYNVLMWRLVLERIPGLKNLGSITDTLFSGTEVLVGGKPTNLKALENDVIRARFRDPRVHMALNCASGGCPRLAREAFTPEKLDAQLDREARTFVGEKRNVDFDPATRRLKLSKLFDWYKDDFGGDQARVIAWINRYRSEPLPADAHVEYVDYDWTLNDPHLQR